MSFQQGLSGLNAAAKSLDVTGNNVANSSTVGFKQSRAEFSDIFASSLSGSGSSQIGIGTQVATVQQLFTQGNLTTTENPLDISINGDGFFRLSDNGNIMYTRNGQFQMDEEGYLVTSAGNRLTGYLPDPSNPATLQTGVPTDLKIDAADQPANATTSIDSVLNLDATKTIIPDTTVFNANDTSTYDNTTPVTVYDSLGNSHLVQNYFRKTAANTWSVYTMVDGAAPTTPSTPHTLSFTTAGAVVSSTATQTITFSPAGATAASIVQDFTGSTQFGSAFGVNSLAQDGYTSGRLTSFSTSADGQILGRYSNSQSAVLGQVVLTSFANNNGLQNLGNNTWGETAASGAAVTGTPNSAGLGVLRSSSLEDSNVDLTTELVNMITAQRYYQANAQTIKTQDQVLQTLVNLR